MKRQHFYIDKVTVSVLMVLVKSWHSTSLYLQEHAKYICFNFEVCCLLIVEPYNG